MGWRGLPLLICFSALLQASGAAAAESGAPGLVVLDVKAGHGVPEGVARVLSDVLVVSLGA